MRYYFLKYTNWADAPHPLMADSVKEIDITEYMPVWTDLVDETKPIEEVLETLFYKFNMDHPEHYAAPSMSVMDVVQFVDTKINVYYICCSVGWKEVRLKGND